MKKNILFALVLLLISTFVFVSCNKDKDEDEEVTAVQTGTITLIFEHLWDSIDFEFNTEYTHPLSSEKITISLVKYYISNVKFKKTDGTWWSESESYHLVDASSAAIPEFKISNVPIGDYTDVCYTIGVDSTRNVSGAQTGALSTTNNMFWSWNTGYIFWKVEGTSPSVPDSLSNHFMYHLGGFKKSDGSDVVKMNTQNFNGQLLSVAPTASPSIHFAINIANLWDASGLNSMGFHWVTGQDAQNLANRFQNAFELEHIHN